jgi:hypothetical protein
MAQSGLGEADLICATLVAVVVAPFDNWGSGIVPARAQLVDAVQQVAQANRAVLEFRA